MQRAALRAKQDCYGDVSWGFESEKSHLVAKGTRSYGKNVETGKYPILWDNGRSKFVSYYNQ